MTATHQVIFGRWGYLARQGEWGLVSALDQGPPWDPAAEGVPLAIEVQGRWRGAGGEQVRVVQLPVPGRVAAGERSRRSFPLVPDQLDRESGLRLRERVEVWIPEERTWSLDEVRGSRRWPARPGRLLHRDERGRELYWNRNLGRWWRDHGGDPGRWWRDRPRRDWSAGDALARAEATAARRGREPGGGA